MGPAGAGAPPVTRPARRTGATVGDGRAPPLDRARRAAHNGRVSDPDPSYEQRVERHLVEWRRDRRARRRFWVRTCVLMWIVALPGIACAAWAFHVTDPELGGILLQSGQVLVVAGVLGVLSRAVLVARERGWY